MTPSEYSALRSVTHNFYQVWGEHYSSERQLLEEVTWENLQSRNHELAEEVRIARIQHGNVSFQHLFNGWQPQFEPRNSGVFALEWYEMLASWLDNDMEELDALAIRRSTYTDLADGFHASPEELANKFPCLMKLAERIPPPSETPRSLDQELMLRKMNMEELIEWEAETLLRSGATEEQLSEVWHEHWKSTYPAAELHGSIRKFLQLVLETPEPSE